MPISRELYKLLQQLSKKELLWPLLTMSKHHYNQNEYPADGAAVYNGQFHGQADPQGAKTTISQNHFCPDFSISFNHSQSLVAISNLILP